MLGVQHTEVYGWQSAIRGMRNPLNSWKLSDSNFSDDEYGHVIGENDLKLMRKLIKAGTDHSKFMRYISVSCDITAPLYWWKEYDTYKVATVANSTSTMHKIHAKEFTLEDFSHEHLGELDDYQVEYGDFVGIGVLECTISALNFWREKYLETKDKFFWWQMIQSLPTSYNQTRTVLLNYQVLRSMYHARKSHKLDEWHQFCKWVESLPHSELITEV